MIQSAATIDFTIPAMREWRKLPEGILAEVIDRKLCVSPSPTPYHQTVCLKIKIDLFNHVFGHRLGEIYDVPTDLFLTEGTCVVIPDIIFVATGSNVVVDRKGLHGVPDMLVEVLSPGTRKRDLTVKKALYEKAGVKEYWLVDPETKDSQGYILKNRYYGDPLLMNAEIYIRILKKTIRF